VTIFHGYVLLKKPPVLSSDEWYDVLSRLRGVLDHLPYDWDITKNLHWRFSLSGNEVLVCAGFNSEDLDIENLARLPAYIQAAVPQYTVAQVRDAMRTNIVILGGAMATFAESSAYARQYILDNLAEWEMLLAAAFEG